MIAACRDALIIIASLAILASLIFVGRQLRHSKRMERAAAQRDLLLRVAEWLRIVQQESDVAFDKFVSEFVFIAESALNMRKDGFPELHSVLPEAVIS